MSMVKRIIACMVLFTILSSIFYVGYGRKSTYNIDINHYNSYEMLSVDYETDINNNIANENRKMLDETLEELLSEEGFEDDDIQKTKSIADGIIFNLREIKNIKLADSVKVSNEIYAAEDPSKQNAEIFEELEQKFDKNTAVYYMLKLESDFLSMEAVLDEYLYALQVDVDFGIYLEDKDKYNTLILEKSAILTRQDAIKYADIETYMLEALYLENQSNASVYIDPGNNINIPADLSEDITDFSDIRPKDPMQDVMDEINGFKKRSVNGG